MFQDVKGKCSTLFPSAMHIVVQQQSEPSGCRKTAGGREGARVEGKRHSAGCVGERGGGCGLKKYLLTKRDLGAMTNSNKSPGYNCWECCPFSLQMS